MPGEIREIKAEGQTLVSRVAGTDLTIEVRPDGSIEIKTGKEHAGVVAMWAGRTRIIIMEEVD